MDSDNLVHKHRNFEGGSVDPLSAESLPLIDMRLLSQSELRALSSLSPSLSSSTSLATSSGVHDDLTPKIDRSVFNESAGSRKQTFQRLRLARHPQQLKPPSPQRQIDDSFREEHASLLKTLFSVDSIQTESEEDEGEEEIQGQPQFSFPICNNSFVYPNPDIDSVENVLVQGSSGNRKRGRGKMIQNPRNLEINEGSLSVDKSCSNLGTESRNDDSGISMDSNPSNRKRSRPEDIVNLDLTALANTEEDPYGMELRRITERFKTKEELVGYMEQLNGEWVNAGKMKKVVKACDFGGYLPIGWKLMLCITNKSNLCLECHRYISPDGHEFATFKEVSTYLQSRNETRLNSDNKTLGLTVMANESKVANSDTIDAPVLSTDTNQNLESKRTSENQFGGDR